MCCKKVFLKVYSSKTPCQISVLSCHGCPIKTETICSSFSEICFYTTSSLIFVNAKYNCQTICKKICLKNCCCQNVCVNFDFNEETEQIITLSDANYGLPVENAILNFAQNRQN